MTDTELFREYYRPRDHFRRPAETERLREEIRRRVDALRALNSRHLPNHRPV